MEPQPFEQNNRGRKSGDTVPLTTSIPKIACCAMRNDPTFNSLYRRVLAQQRGSRAGHPATWPQPACLLQGCAVVTLNISSLFI